ncbi:MAG: flagellar basal body P-ring formation protein FlgA [Alteromonadaceae bacterium]|nr:flagellar basal body P-ring formation protein FlgA [Alteromonadaceae bacterium]
MIRLAVLLLFMTLTTDLLAIEARLKSGLYVGSSTVKAGSIIHFANGKSALLAKLSNMEITLPQEDKLSVHKLAELLNSVAKEKINWSGNKVLRLRLMQKISLNEISETAQEFLESFMETEQYKGSVSLITSPTNVWLPLGDISYKVQNGTFFSLKKRTLVTISVEVNNKEVEKILLWYSVKAKRFGFVVKSELSKGDVITKAEVIPQWVSIFNGPVTLSDFENNEFRTVRHLGAGVTLQRRYIEKIPLVDAGDLVEITLKKGNISISAFGKVLEKGYLNQVVLVKLNNAASAFKAKVIKKGVVSAL